MMRFSCLLLAAGRSTRMEGPNKLLLKIGNTSLVRRTANEISRLPFQEVVVVTGYDNEKIVMELEAFPFKTTYNENHFNGMHSSIRRGLSALKSECDAFFVCLGDQPYFNAEVLQMMMASFERNQAEKRIFYPSFDGERGQPVLIGAEFIDEVLNHDDGDHGCAYLFESYPLLTRPVLMPTRSVMKDIDRPQDYHSFLESTHG